MMSKLDELILVALYYFLKTWKVWAIAIPVGLVALGYSLA